MATTIKDVAKYAGVGVGTVSRVLNGEKAVNEETRKLIFNAIRELNYVPNRMAVRLRKNESKIVALLVPVVDHPFFAKFAYYAEDEADKFGYSVLLVSSQHRKEKETEIISKIRRREVDGAIFVTHYQHDEQELCGCPIVSIDRQLAKDIPYVTSDNYESTKKAVRYLHENGCKKIGYVGSKPLVASEVMLREDAYRDTVEALGMSARITNDVIEHGEERKVVEEFLDRFPDVDGVFASGYTMAQTLYEAAKARGVKIPETLQIISYDGAFRQWGGEGKISCMEQPVEEMARAVVRLLLAKMAGEETESRTVLKTSFVRGETTK